MFVLILSFRPVKVRMAAQYLLDLSLTDVRMVSVLASTRAAAAVWVARRMLEVDPTKKVWTATLAYYTSKSETSLRPVIERYAKSLLKAEHYKFQVGVYI